MATSKKYITIKAGDRIDLLALRLYGDVSKYDILMKANPTIDIWKPKPGQRILIPDA